MSEVSQAATNEVDPATAAAEQAAKLHEALHSRLYTVIDAGTMKVRFHIPGLHLRNELYSDDILQYYDVQPPRGLTHEQYSPVAIFGLISHMIKASNGPIGLRKKLMQMIEESAQDQADGEEGVAPVETIASAILRELDNVQRLATEKFQETGNINFAELPFLLPVDQTIVCSDGDNVKYAGEVTDVETKRSMFGDYIQIDLRVIAISKKGVTFGSKTVYIGDFKDRKNLTDLGLQFPTDSLRQQLIARGRRFMEVTAVPSYMAYNTTLVRRAWYGSHEFRAYGRVMVDIKSMGMMDPNYKEFFAIEQYGDDDDTGAKIDPTNEKQLLICSPYVYGFSLVSKVWGELRLDNLSDIEFREDAFDKLALDARYKRMLNAQVSANDSSDSGDIIAGKGGGLIYLLHGDPGIGKTLTAEAISEKLKRPLYSVSTGELGTEPDTLDERLKNILEMAATWNAILLIDEADIFLEARSAGDVHRNAMVGIFLKLLEYYEGILFLTTNRARNIDTAFYSRISLAINYPKLDVQKRTLVWNNLLKYVGEYASDVSITDLALLDLNGRQIKHIVRQARTLARFEGRMMCAQDLKDVIELVMQFNTFLTEGLERQQLNG